MLDGTVARRGDGARTRGLDHAAALSPRDDRGAV